MYKGESVCSKCSRKCYWQVGKDYFCGFHADKTKRIALKPNPNIAEQRKEKYTLFLKEAQKFCDRGKVGKLIVRRSKMFGETILEKGYFTVLPNFRAKSSSNLIIAAKELSPMFLGPIIHGQKDLPDSCNLENFHQFNKVFSCEVDEDENVLPIWFERQLEGYNNPVPQRHKLGKTKAEHLKAIGKSSDENPNHCLYSLFKNPKTDKLQKYSYLKSRVFYCTYYERLVKNQDKYKMLLKMYKSGAKLLISGFDARNVDSATIDDIYDWYNDAARPFGHEMVLYTMLKLHDQPEMYPWRNTKLGFEL